MNMTSMALRVASVLVASPKPPAGPEAPIWAPFGQWAWAGRREGVPEEPDTEVETQVFEDLKRHFTSTRTGLPATTAALLSTFLSLGWYRPVLHPPPYATLYRGLKLTSKAGLIALIGYEPEEEDGATDFADGTLAKSENGNSSSWTFRKAITEDFSAAGKRGYSVTLVADVADNQNRFLAGPGGLYDVEGMSRWHLEKETVGLDPIVVRRIEWSRL
jgi:hypothetical protein